MRTGLVVAALLVPWALQAQMKLFVLQQGVEQAVGASYQVGTVAAGDFVDTAFRVRNTSAASAWLQGLNVAGYRFSFASLPQLPVQMVAGGSLDFLVRFAPLDFGSYSAYLNINGVPTILMGTGQAAAMLSLMNGATRTALVNGDSVDFGSTELGSQSVRSFELANPTTQVVPVQALAASGASFSLSTALALPLTLQPQQTVSFQVTFAPAAVGQQQGALQVAGRWYPLTGIGRAPSVPQPQIVIDPVALRGGQQAKVSVQLASASQAAASGSLSMDFTPSVPGKADDPAIQFPATGSRTIALQVSSGDTMARFSGQTSTEFQTGTTAGTITFTVTLGSYKQQLTAVVPSAPVVVDAASATRAATGIAVQITGFDTSRSASLLSFTFYDMYGHTIAPGVLQIDASKPFLNYFGSTVLGSMFTLQVVFPVQGDSSQIVAMEAALSNALGNTQTDRVQIK